MNAPAERRALVMHRLAYALLALSVAAALLLAPWARPFGPWPPVVLAVVVAAHRHWGQRVQSGTAWYFTHLALVAGLVVVAPMSCLYAFVGYLEAGDRVSSRRLSTLALVVTAVLCALGEVGGIATVRVWPWLFVIVLLANLGIAPLMDRIFRQYEAELAGREAAVAALEREQARTAALQEQLIEQAREAGVADERARLSREIHDTVAQGLIAVITQLDAISPDDSDGDRRARIERAADMARLSLAEARRAIAALGPVRLEDADLPDALRAAAREWSEATGIAARVVVDGRPRRGPSDEALLRVAQEALANAARHSEASGVTLALSYLTDSTRLDVRDDGRGFDPARLEEGSGIAGMRARLAQLGGTLDLESASGEGCTVGAAVPA